MNESGLGDQKGHWVHGKKYFKEITLIVKYKMVSWGGVEIGTSKNKTNDILTVYLRKRQIYKH